MSITHKTKQVKMLMIRSSFHLRLAIFFLMKPMRPKGKKKSKNGEERQILQDLKGKLQRNVGQQTQTPRGIWCKTRVAFPISQEREHRLLIIGHEKVD